MDTKYWGKQFWTSLFSIALTYPEDPTVTDQHNYKNFYVNLKYVLPCHVCKKNYRKKLKKYPINKYLKKGREGLFYWTLKIHNSIAKELGKKQLSKDNVLNKYFNNQRQRQNCESFCAFVFGLVVSSIGYYILKNRT